MKAEIILLKKHRHKCLLKIVLREGRNRQIRRIAKSLGHQVIDLQRTSIENISLNNLPEGAWRELNKFEFNYLMKLTSLSYRKS